MEVRSHSKGGSIQLPMPPGETGQPCLSCPRWPLPEPAAQSRPCPALARPQTSPLKRELNRQRHRPPSPGAASPGRSTRSPAPRPCPLPLPRGWGQTAGVWGSPPELGVWGPGSETAPRQRKGKMSQTSTKAPQRRDVLEDGSAEQTKLLPRQWNKTAQDRGGSWRRERATGWWKHRARPPSCGGYFGLD